MASVSNIDQDLRDLRLSRYTPSAANEVRRWIEDTLHEKLPPGDLLDVLKDGTVLCRLVNLACDPGVKFRGSNMPFVQMENISQFLRACQTPPLNLKEHDVFLTVDLYEKKDPTQVLQCLSAFSRRVHALFPNRFPRPVGPKTISPQSTGTSQAGSARAAPPKPPKPVSTWSKKEEEFVTQPAWSIHQYGYMGGANQANMGINFGARRGITTYADGPRPPTLAEKEQQRKAAAEQHRIEAERRERQIQAELQAEEIRAREEEERMWNEETKKLLERERAEAEEEKKRWAEEQRLWEEEEQRKRNEEQAFEERIQKEREHRRGQSDAHLSGQFLNQVQPSQPVATNATGESERIKELERQLAEAKERERQYQLERQQAQESELRFQKSRSPTRSAAPPVSSVKPSYAMNSQEEERLALRGAWMAQNQTKPAPPLPSRAKPPRAASGQVPINHTSTSFTQTTNRTDRYLDQNPAPEAKSVNVFRPPEYSTDAEVDAENARRLEAQKKTQAGSWASKSLLEREKELERQRQREWEEEQERTRAAASRGIKTADPTPGGGAWDVHQYGYLGGDNQNRGGPGLSFGGRRQIIGNPPPSS